MIDVKVTVSVRSDVGRVRTNNEDAFIVAELTTGARLDAIAAGAVFDLPDDGLLLAVSDGMGGRDAGELASAVVLASLHEALAAERTGPVEGRIETAVRLANAAVLRTAHEQNTEGMGATLTAVLVIGGQAHVAQVGDSRAYLCRGGRLWQLTRDQSLVQMLVDSGKLAPHEAKRSPQKNVILQSMGLAEQVNVAIARLALRRLDTLLVCSDGVSNAITADELLRILSWHEPRGASARLIELANQRGGEDNLTVIVAQFDGVGLDPASSSESPADVFEVIQSFGGA